MDTRRPALRRALRRAGALVASAALGLLLATLAGTPAGAQSGLEQSKSTSTTPSDLFSSGGYPEGMIETLEANGIDTSEGGIDDVMQTLPVTQAIGDEQGLFFRGPFTLTSGARMDPASGWYTSLVVVSWFDEQVGVITPITEHTDPRVTEVDPGCFTQVVAPNDVRELSCHYRVDGQRRLARTTIKSDATAPVVSLTGIEAITDIFDTNVPVFLVGRVPEIGCETVDPDSPVPGPNGSVLPGSGIAELQAAQLQRFGPDDGGPTGYFSVGCFGGRDRAGNFQVDWPIAAYRVVEPEEPAVEVEVTGPLGDDGWYIGDVSLTWHVSGVDLTLDGCIDRTISVDGALVYYRCEVTDYLGHTAELVQPVRRDTGAPRVTIVDEDGGPVDGRDFAEGAEPDVRCLTTDDVSGVGTAAVPVVTGEAPGEITVTCDGAVDRAGNPQQAPVTATYLVLTPPSVSSMVAGTLGNEGWYTTHVQISWTTLGSDLASLGCGLVELSGDQHEASYTCTATNAVGSAGQTLTIKLDVTAPTVTVTGVEDGEIHTLGAVPDIGCETTDGRSGVAVPATLAVSGGPVGTVTATCAGAEDVAGNVADAVSVTFQVHYPFGGFGAPVDPGSVNVVNAGQTVPIRFSLSGDRGLGILAAGSPSSRAVPCAGGVREEQVTETAESGSKGLTYDAREDQYVFTWSTNRAWRGTCRELTVGLVDGSRRTLQFSFR